MPKNWPESYDVQFSCKENCIIQIVIIFSTFTVPDLCAWMLEVKWGPQKAG